MKSLKQFRYDFFGEFLTQENGINNGIANDPLDSNKNVPCHHNHDQPQSPERAKAEIEDSLMEFITDYFQGNVTEDFSEAESFQSVQERCSMKQESNKKLKERIHVFDYSSSSEINTSAELFTSPDTSMFQNAADHDQSMEGNEETGDSNIFPPVEQPCPQSRRKSISYDIIFTNSKDQNGKVKIHIISNKKTSAGLDQTSVLNYYPRQKQLNLNLDYSQENAYLRQRIHDLERKLHCIEIESERVVGELSKIIERKNEIISQLELQIAGVKIMS